MIRVDLERPSVEAGGTVRGSVTVTVDPPGGLHRHLTPELLQQARALQICVIMKTQRLPATLPSLVIPIKTLPGPIAHGDQLLFEVKLPETPLSFEGQLLVIDWFVRARLDLPWTRGPFSPVCDEPFKLLPRGYTEKMAAALLSRVS